MTPRTVILEKVSKSGLLKVVRGHVSLKSHLVSYWNSSLEPLIPFLIN